MRGSTTGDAPERPRLSVHKTGWLARSLPLLAASVVVGSLLFSFRFVPGSQPQALPADLAETPLPNRFTQWPPFVLSWKVTGAPSGGREASSPLGAGFTRFPCRALGSDTCYVRLAWHDLTRWSLTASHDLMFGEDDPSAFTVGSLHYGVADGVMLGELASDRLPQMHLCQRLLHSKNKGESISVGSLDASGFISSAGVLLERHSAESASCLSPAGIPVAFSEAGVRWEGLGFEQRRPTEEEIGWPLVEAVVDVLDPQPCIPRSGLAFSASPAGRWLLGLAGQSAGFVAAPAGSGIVLSTATSRGLRTAFVWITADRQSVIPPGARQREVGHGLVVDEIIEPSLVQSVPVGDLRIWVRLEIDPGRPRSILEREAFVLGGISKQLVSAAEVQPYGGRGPSGFGAVPRGALPIIAQHDSFLDVSAQPAQVPHPDIWEWVGELANGLPIWEADSSGSYLVMGGGLAFEVKVDEALLDDPIGSLDRIQKEVDNALPCPWMGIPAQPESARIAAGDV